MSKLSKISVVSSLLLLSPQMAAAQNGEMIKDPTPINTADQKVTDVKRAPIPFTPFPMVNPISGKAVAPTDEIIVAGTFMKAEDYFKRLNAYEKDLNDRGFTLRNKADLEVMAKADLDMAAIIESARIQSLLNIDFDPRIMEKAKEAKAVLDDAKATALDWEDKVLRGFETLASSNDPNGFQAKLTKLDEKVVKTPQLPALSGNTHKEWGFGPSNRDQMYISGKAIFHLGAAKTKAEVLATARMDGKVLSQEFNLFYGHIKGDGDLALSKQEANSTLSAEIYFNSLGRERFKWSKSSKKSTKLPDILPKEKDKPAVASAGTPSGAPSSATAVGPGTPIIPGESGDEGKESSVSEWLAVTRESLKLEPWKYQTGKSWIWYFSIGPVPGHGELGIDGTAYVDWGSGVNVSGGRANLTFGANTSVWASGNVGIEVLRAGVYAKLILVDAQFNFQGSAIFRLGDGALAGDPQNALTTAYKEKLVLEPQIVSEIRGDRRLTFLKGEVGAYAEIPMPKASDPFWEKKRYTYEVFNWDGYSKDGVIFSFKKVNSLGSYNVFGAETKEDVDSAQLDKNLDDHFNGILADSGNADVLNRQKQLLQEKEAALAEFKTFIDTL